MPKINLRKSALLLLSLGLFILALQLMKQGAQALTPLLQGHLALHNPANTLGFGWLSAYLLMSGSPIAAAALTFLDVGAIDRLQTFTMITGSRLGASFIVLFIGFLYALRGHGRQSSLAMGLLSLTITGVTYTGSLVLGWLTLSYNLLDFIKPFSGVALSSLIAILFDPLVDLCLAHLPRWAVFLVGMGTIMGSFALFDQALPQINLRQTSFAEIPRLVYRPLVMFTLGFAVTLVSMSVSVSLSFLVPLSARGYIRQENVIPYIMGANVSTFVDTLLAAVLLGNHEAFTVVLVEMLSIAFISLVILIFIYRDYECFLLGFVSWVNRNNRNLSLFMVAIFLLPILLLLF